MKTNLLPLIFGLLFLVQFSCSTEEEIGSETTIETPGNTTGGENNQGNGSENNNILDITFSDSDLHSFELFKFKIQQEVNLENLKVKFGGLDVESSTDENRFIYIVIPDLATGNHDLEIKTDGKDGKFAFEIEATRKPENIENYILDNLLISMEELEADVLDNLNNEGIDEEWKNMLQFGHDLHQMANEMLVTMNYDDKVALAKFLIANEISIDPDQNQSQSFLRNQINLSQWMNKYISRQTVLALATGSLAAVIYASNPIVAVALAATAVYSLHQQYKALDSLTDYIYSDKILLQPLDIPNRSVLRNQTEESLYFINGIPRLFSVSAFGKKLSSTDLSNPDPVISKTVNQILESENYRVEIFNIFNKFISVMGSLVGYEEPSLYDYPHLPAESQEVEMNEPFSNLIVSNMPADISSQIKQYENDQISITLNNNNLENQENSSVGFSAKFENEYGKFNNWFNGGLYAKTFYATFSNSTNQSQGSGSGCTSEGWPVEFIVNNSSIGVAQVGETIETRIPYGIYTWNTKEGLISGTVRDTIAPPTTEINQSVICYSNGRSSLSNKK